MRRFTLLVICLFLSSVPVVHADTVVELRTKIDGNRSEIQKIESEIALYESQLKEVQGEKQTLQSAISELDYSRKKTNANIQLTQAEISQTQDKILTLSEQIQDKRLQINNGVDGVAEALRRMDEQEGYSLVELVLRSANMASAWTAIDALQQFQTVTRGRVQELELDRAALEATREAREKEQRTLESQKDELASQKLSLDINRNEKSSLLNKTKSQEDAYQQLLKEKRDAKAEMEAAITAFEARLQYILDPSSLPSAGEGVLLYPLSNVYITQYFGNTPFASSGAYSGKGHNGIDFRAAVGTRVNAAQSGTVLATGNTDAIRGCYSYGKWIVIKHNNGLSTLYAHLSSISVSPGEGVEVGQRIGYSGNTGYSTGPHLHFTVFASNAVRIVRMGDIKTRTNCADAMVPIAPTAGYLNPLNYL